MATLHLPRPERLVLDLAARVVGRIVKAADTMLRPDDEIVHYATSTYQKGVLVASTPQVTYGDLRRRG